MLLVTQHELFHWISAVFWPFLRMTGVLLTAPILGAQTVIPVPFRVLLSLLFAACLAAWGGPWPAIPQNAFAIFYDGVVQISVGAGIGLVGQIIVSAVGAGGEIAGSALGLGFARVSGLGRSAPPPVLYDVFYWVGLMVYLGMGGMFLTIQAVAHSFHGLPGGVPPVQAFAHLARFTSVILSSGVLVALPALAAGLALNAVTGLANALAPQVNVFSIGFPLLFLGGIWILATAVFYIEPIVGNLLVDGTRALGVWTQSSP